MFHTIIIIYLFIYLPCSLDRWITAPTRAGERWLPFAELRRDGTCMLYPRTTSCLLRPLRGKLDLLSPGTTPTYLCCQVNLELQPTRNQR